MSDTPHFMKKNPENNEVAAIEPLTSKKRGANSTELGSKGSLY